jgi:hypothetical protein
MENYHVIKNGSSWVLKKEGEDRIVVSFGSDRKRAIRISSGYLKMKQATLKIHESDEKLGKERGFWRGSFPARSKREDVPAVRNCGLFAT